MASDISCKLTIKALKNEWGLTRQIDSWQEYDLHQSSIFPVLKNKKNMVFDMSAGLEMYI